MRRAFTLIFVALLAGCDGQAPEQKPADPVALVRTAPVVTGTGSNDVAAYGVTEAGPGGERALVVPAEAIVASIAAPTGTAVAAGQIVVTLRPSPATRAAAAKAASDAAVATAAYQRALRMRGDGLVGNAEVETARGALATADAVRANLGIAGGVAMLRTAVAGTVQGLTAKPGDQLPAGTTIATIGGLGDLRARFGVDPALAQRIRPGMAITISTIDGTRTASAAVVGVDPQIDPATRLSSLYAQIPAGLHLGAGAPLRASLAVGAAANQLSIPYTALLDDGGHSYVFVVKDGVARRVAVSPGTSSGDRIQILRGLEPGDTVVTEGGTALEDGMKVTEPPRDSAKQTTRDSARRTKPGPAR